MSGKALIILLISFGIHRSLFSTTSRETLVNATWAEPWLYPQSPPRLASNSLCSSEPWISEGRDYRWVMPHQANSAFLYHNCVLGSELGDWQSSSTFYCHTLSLWEVYSLHLLRSMIGWWIKTCSSLQVYAGRITLETNRSEGEETENWQRRELLTCF